MSLETVPEDILEEIFQYLSANDLTTVIALGWQGTETFWRRICEREAFQRVAEDDNWRDVFRRNVNWRTGTYTKVKYHCKLPLVEDGGGCKLQLLHGRNLIFANNGGVSIYNIAKKPKLLLRLDSVLLATSDSKLLLQDSSGIVSVYKRKNYSYRQLLTFDSFPKLRQNFAFTDEFIVVLESLTLKVTNLQTQLSESVILSFNGTKIQPILLVISNCILYLLVLDNTEYKLRRYHLRRREWLEEVIVFRNATMIEVPQLRVNESLVVCWSRHLEGRNSVPMRVWSITGDELNTEHPPWSPEPDKILFLALAGERVILSSRETSLTIWTLSRNICSEMDIPGRFLDYKVISNSLLVLSGSSLATVIDLVKAAVLYNLPYEQDFTSLTICERKHFCANELFLVNVYCNSLNFNGKSDQTTLQNSAGKNKSSRLRDVLLSVYDFT